jgi:hypothetical protein
MHLVKPGREAAVQPTETAAAPASGAKNKLRAAWISFFGRILAQVIGAGATLAIGILLAGRLRSVTLEPLPAAGDPAHSPELPALALLDVREAFVLYDRDRDGVLAGAELPPPLWQSLRAADADQDGALSKDELYEARERARARSPR